MVVPLAAAAVGPRGVVLTLAAQLPLVKHAAVGVQVALAPETERESTAHETVARGIHSKKKKKRKKKLLCFDKSKSWLSCLTRIKARLFFPLERGGEKKKKKRATRPHLSVPLRREQGRRNERHSLLSEHQTGIRLSGGGLENQLDLPYFDQDLERLELP